MQFDTFLDVRPPKSPKRFFTSPFSPTRSTRSPLPPAPPVPTMPLPSPPSGRRKSHAPHPSTSLGLGHGAQVVRTPAEALRGIRQPLTPGLPGVVPRTSMKELWQPRTAPPLRHQVSDGGPVAKGRAGNSFTSREDFAPGAASHADNEPSHHRQSTSPSPRIDLTRQMSTFDPFGKPSTPPDKCTKRITVRLPPGSTPATTRITPFAATLISKTTQAAPTFDSVVLVQLNFGFSLDENAHTTAVTIPWSSLNRYSGHLTTFIAAHLDEDAGPEMTDGSSAEDSDLESDAEYDLNNLLRDEYLRSLWIASPSQLESDVPPVPPLPDITRKRSSVRPAPVISHHTIAVRPLNPAKKRAATRNQYTQLHQYPSPLSPFRSNSLTVAARRNAPPLRIEELDGGGKVITLVVLLHRDASCYDALAARLATDSWPKMDASKRKRLEDEMRWLEMGELVKEVETLKQRSMVMRGGEGYV